jgi:hypothetical protein
MRTEKHILPRFCRAPNFSDAWSGMGGNLHSHGSGANNNSTSASPLKGSIRTVSVALS